MPHPDGSKIVGLATFDHDSNAHASMPVVTELSAHCVAACRSAIGTNSQQPKLS
jgi:hypothetical protein